MFCAQCHSPNADDNKFCSECGLRLTPSALVASDTPEVAQLLSRAFTLLEQGDLAEAHTAVDAALALDPDSSSAHSVRGILFEREGKIADAIREFELVVARNPDSSADRAKLEALRGNVTMSFQPRRWTSQQITLASALAAGLVVFGGGLYVISQPQPHRGEGKSQTARLQPSSAVALPATANTGPAGPQPLRPLPTAPPPKVGTLHGPPAPMTVHAAMGSPAAPVFAAPGRQSVLRPSPPIGPQGMPPVGAAGKSGPVGLPPAAIGEVVPLPQAPAVAPGGPAVASAAVPPPAASATTPGNPGTTPPPAAEAPKTATPAEPKPRVEPLEPETGFIKIEPLKGNGENRAAAAGTAKAASPSISIDIASSGGDEAAIAEAQRAQRNAFNAARVANLEDAERHYRQAASLYELLVKRGGSTARQAREGLDACRKALAALH